MQVNNISTPTSFKSKFIPNPVLEKSFDRAASESDRIFLISVKAFLNDGKNDILEIRQKSKHSLNLHVNNKITEEGHPFLNFYYNTGADLIKKHASKVFGINTGKYNELTIEEKKLVQNYINKIKSSTENFENNCSDFFDLVKNNINLIKKVLDENTKKEIQELKQIIFK